MGDLVQPQIEAESVQVRAHGPAEAPTLIYLPGLHGDWTLIGSFRKALGQRARLIELTYPRTLDWSLDDYAREIESALLGQGLSEGWLLGESFGSQIAWRLASRTQVFLTNGVIVAGGFAVHPMRWAVRLAEGICGSISLGLLTRILFGYARIARLRFRHSPETLASIDEFISRRTRRDQMAAKHRLHLLAAVNSCTELQNIRCPVYGLSGLFDPVVPWPWSRRSLRRNCPMLRGYRVVPRADHNVLSTAPEVAADQVVKWMGAIR